MEPRPLQKLLLWVYFTLGYHRVYLCVYVIIIHYLSLKQRKLKE